MIQNREGSLAVYKMAILQSDLDSKTKAITFPPLELSLPKLSSNVVTPKLQWQSLPPVQSLVFDQLEGFPSNTMLTMLSQPPRLLQAVLRADADACLSILKEFLSRFSFDGFIPISSEIYFRCNLHMFCIYFGLFCLFASLLR